MSDLNLTLNRYYKTKNGTKIKIISQRGDYFLGMSIDQIPFTYWYTPKGRLYGDAISPFDLEKELRSKIEFSTEVEQLEDRLRLKWPKSTGLKDLAGSKVKVTIEIIDG